VTNEVRSPKRWLIGEPLASEKLEGQLLPKHLALPLFASDPLSSVAYAPQELLMILMLGGLSFLTFAPGVALAVVVLLVVVVASYRQLIKASRVVVATTRSPTKTSARRPDSLSRPPCWSIT
jgi:hypothetical protein